MTQRTLARKLVREFAKRGFTLCVAESCTGGLIGKCITDIAGSSAVFAGGFLTYTNEVKTQLLGVPQTIFATDTEVSHACAKAMAEGAKRVLQTDFAVSATGFAGPGGGNERDPVGTVYLGIATPCGTYSRRYQAPEGATRMGVRQGAATQALALLLEYATAFQQEDRAAKK